MMFGRMAETTCTKQGLCTEARNYHFTLLDIGREAHLNGHVFMSDWTEGSSILRPMRRLASKTVLLGFIATCTGVATLLSVAVRPHDACPNT